LQALKIKAMIAQAVRRIFSVKGRTQGTEGIYIDFY
jgi:hypothetical protein